MRIARHQHQGAPRLAAVAGGDLVDLFVAVASHLSQLRGIDFASAARIASRRVPTDIEDVFADPDVIGAVLEPALAHVASLDEAARARLRREGGLLSVNDRPLLPPLAGRARIFCTGLNYRAHVAEGGPRSVDELPAFHLRTHESFVGHRVPLVRPSVSEQLDWEIELTAVIGVPGRYIPVDEAMRHIAGYTIMNEGSVRDYQRRTRHSTPGKNFDASGSLGPWIVTADEIGAPEQLTLHTEVNGVQMQHGIVSDLIFDIATLVAQVSEFAALRPGDLIATGSPAGVALHRVPPPWLAPGDVVSFSVDRIGRLEHPVVAEQP